MNHGSVAAASTPAFVAKAWERCRGYSSFEKYLLQIGRLDARGII